MSNLRVRLDKSIGTPLIIPVSSVEEGERLVEVVNKVAMFCSGGWFGVEEAILEESPIEEAVELSPAEKAWIHSTDAGPLIYDVTPNTT